MSKRKYKLPQWQISARKNVNIAKSNINKIRQIGQADIKRGLETVKLADQRIHELNYVEQLLNQDLPSKSQNDEIIQTLGTYLAGTANAYQQNSGYYASQYSEYNINTQSFNEKLYEGFSTEGSPSGSMVFMGAQIRSRLEVISPSSPMKEIILPEKLSRKKVFDDLAVLLTPFDPSYLSMLKGSEEALHNINIDDHLSQAAHSIRDLFQNLIEQLAPSDAVKLQPWYRPTPGAPGGVSRLSRIKYILYGIGNIDDHGLEQLDLAAEDAKNALDLAIARAHDHDLELTEKEVELAIDQARFSLSEILKRHTERQGKFPK